ncbi:hypothetical protein BZA77DRAFT_378558 [Pyronema omphalodes]|nr:hypothetical protein BZA77DRAFT_378558 [Pyronema omphalodes]
MPLIRHLLDCTSLPISTLTSHTPPLLPPSAISKAQRYHFPADQSLSLGSSLLQRHIISTHYHHNLLSAPITIEASTNRPFHTASEHELKPGKPVVEDYNVSHHRAPEGEKSFCVLAAIIDGPNDNNDDNNNNNDTKSTEKSTQKSTQNSTTPTNNKKRRRIGTDIVPTTHPRDQADFISTMCDTETGVFTPYEVSQIMASGPGDKEKVRCLYLYWALKEAYVKAVGTGIVGDVLLRVEFRGVAEAAQAAEAVEGAVAAQAADAAGGAEGAVTAESQQPRKEVTIHINGQNESQKWYTEVSHVRGNIPDQGFWVVVCCDRTAVTEGDKVAGWRELTVAEMLRECGVELGE